MTYEFDTVDTEIADIFPGMMSRADYETKVFYQWADNILSSLEDAKRINPASIVGKGRPVAIIGSLTQVTGIFRKKYSGRKAILFPGKIIKQDVFPEHENLYFSSDLDVRQIAWNIKREEPPIEWYLYEEVERKPPKDYVLEDVMGIEMKRNKYAKPKYINVEHTEVIPFDIADSAAKTLVKGLRILDE
jgi:hypothetical protein